MNNGKIRARNIFTPNEIVINADYAEVVLYNKYCEERARTKIDIQDIELVKNIKWSYANGYVRNSNQNIIMHRLITNAPEGMVVDHINRDPLDNRRFNLRICTQTQNLMNKVVRKDASSGVKGVFYHKRDKLWIARIHANSKRIRLGGFKNKNDAIKARQKAEIKYFGEYNYKVVE